MQQNYVQRKNLISKVRNWITAVIIYLVTTKSLVCLIPLQCTSKCKLRRNMSKNNVHIETNVLRIFYKKFFSCRSAQLLETDFMTGRTFRIGVTST